MASAAVSQPKIPTKTHNYGLSETSARPAREHEPLVPERRPGGRWPGSCVRE